MAVKRTRTGYQLWWYDVEGRFRKQTFRGIGRDEAIRLEREILAARDRGERPPDDATRPPSRPSRRPGSTRAGPGGNRRPWPSISKSSSRSWGPSSATSG